MTNPTNSPAARPVPCAAQPALFFSDARADIVAAQRICGRCPILAQCAARTLTLDDDTHGVFASVRLTLRATQEVRRAAREQLAAVAATGHPAPLYTDRFRAWPLKAVA